MLTYLDAQVRANGGREKEVMKNVVEGSKMLEVLEVIKGKQKHGLERWRTQYTNSYLLG